MTRFQKSSFISGAILIVIAIILGAFGAHSLEKAIPVDKLETFEVGVRYQMYHGFGLLFLGLISSYLSTSLKWSLRLMLFGVLFFSGSIYILATQSLLGLDISKIIGPITPIGGLLLLISWSILIIKIIQEKVKS